MDFHMTLIGLLVGFLVGLTGVGGAALLTPILIMLGIQPTIAVGTDLVYNSITKIVGAFQHWRQGTVNLKIAGWFALGSVPSAVAAVHLLQWMVQIHGGADEMLKKVVGIALIFTTIAMVIETWINRAKPDPNRWQRLEDREKRALTVGIGAVLGFIVGLTSIGSGSLFALALMYFYRLSSKEIVGTDIAHAFVLVTAAGLAHMSYGTVDYPTVFQLLTGSIPGVVAGSMLSARVPTLVLRSVIWMIILASGFKLI